MIPRRPRAIEPCGNSLCRQPLPMSAQYCHRCGLARISASPGRRSTGCLLALLAAIALAVFFLVRLFAR